MKNRFFILVALLFATSSNPASAEKAMNTSNEACAEKQDWPGATDASGTKLGKILAPACRLKSLPGLDFGSGLTVDRCDTVIPGRVVDRDEKANEAKLVSAFGVEEARRIMKPADTSGWLNTTELMSGRSATLVVLSNASGDITHIVATPDQLKKELKAVTSKEGAAALLYLNNRLGSHPLPDAFCEAEFTPDAEGWSVSNAKTRDRLTFAVKSVSFHVSKLGEISQR